ncbi:MAG: tetratricopeptide repeat protein [candidate division Zixibacteria bacterium]|nr:tetratricopeptide repeat protein [candidate division Zixibacteria bacterium]
MINVAELDERIERCLAILADNPHSQVFAALAEAYRRRGDFGRAFSVCKSGLKHHPDYSPAYVVLAKLYLHQKMLPDALTSLQRAVELDGPTRVTDVLEAEIQLALGDIKAAQVVIDRLRMTDPGNVSLPELAEQLKQLRSGTIVPVGSTTPDDWAQSSPRAASEPRPEPECTNWPEWAIATGSLPGVKFAFVAGADGRISAQSPESETIPSKAEIILASLREIEGRWQAGVWGTVGELRIESTHGDVWIGRLKDVIVGFVGSEQLKYGAARQRCLDLAARVLDAQIAAGSIEGRV